MGHILPSDRLDPFLPLPSDDVEQVGLQILAQIVVLALIGSEQGGHHGRPVHLGDGLHEMLEEVHDSLAPDLAHARLAPRIHQHFVHENQGAESLLRRACKQVGQQRFGGGRLALLVLAVGMQRAQPVGSGKLKRKHAPRMLQGACLAVRGADTVDAAFHVDLVEAERNRKRLRQLRTHVLPELLHCLDLGQCGRIAKQVIERDEGVGLAAAVGQLQLPDRLGAPPGKSFRHVLDELAQGVGGKRERKESRRVFIDGPCALSEGDLVEIGGELREGELAASKLLLEADDAVPRRRSGDGHG